ncbi:MAG: bifunctional folylpolyglutamate synthase/dihydrofolate synthase [Paludibacteraceae bacterium]|nr:bifunctional folylpolyglutamate synthase/dihydrofolate synthase [Paludibacteraceae bacterium]
MNTQSNINHKISTFSEALEYLYSSTPAFHLVGASAYKPGLENTQKLMQHLGHPEKKFKAVHIAGTNGKGSTSHLLAAVFQKAGYKTGLYTSPHLVDYRERIRINGQMIPQQRVVDFVNKNMPFLEKVRPSFFETTMAMAFEFFAEQKVDIAIVEVGLGGRLDSTNILTPELSVITNIGYDHTEFLGNTLEQIASEKAGIIKPHIPVVIGERDIQTAYTFIQKAQKEKSPLVFASDRQWIVPEQCQLSGVYQMKNKQTVRCAIEVLRQRGWQLSNWAIEQGFAEVCTLTGLHGRWDVLREKPFIVCDTGHNSHGIKYVARQLRQLECEKLYIVFGMVSDKDVEESLRLLPTDAYYFFTQATTKRAIPATELQRLFVEINKGQDIQSEVFQSVEDAIKTAINRANENDAVFIGGSNYVVGEALKMFSL